MTILTKITEPFKAGLRIKFHGQRWLLAYAAFNLGFVWIYRLIASVGGAPAVPSKTEISVLFRNFLLVSESAFFVLLWWWSGFRPSWAMAVAIVVLIAKGVYVVRFDQMDLIKVAIMLLFALNFFSTYKEARRVE